MKPNYALIKIKGSKELVTVIKRLLKYEGIKRLEDVKYHEGKRYFDIALFAGDRLIIVRNPAGSTKAHIKEFDCDSWAAYKAAEGREDIPGYIQYYNDYIKQLGEGIEWAIRT